MELLPTNVRPLQLDVSSEEFAAEWESCVKNRASDLTQLIQMMQPAFNYWIQLLKGKADSRHDINYVTLCNLLNKQEPNKATSRIKAYVGFRGTDLFWELQMLFIRRLRKMRFFPALARPIAIEYIVARYLKWDTWLDIKRVEASNRHLEKATLYFNPPTIYEPDYNKIVLSREIRDEFDDFQYYLYYLIMEGFNLAERTCILNYDRRNLYKEESKIWHHLKQKYF